MKPTALTATYQTYLLRCWTVHQPTAVNGWRFTLVHPYTNVRRTFTTPAALVDFLQTQLDGVDSATLDTTPQSKQIDD